MNKIRRGFAFAFTAGVAGIVAASLHMMDAAGQYQQPTALFRASNEYGQFPLRFEANVGQTDPRVKFLSRGQGYTVFLTDTEMVLTLAGSAPSPAALTMRLVGADPAPRVAPSDRLPGTSRYFIGNDPARWRTNVASYARVRLEDVYPGVDVIYYGNQRQLEYDFVVEPNADPRAVRMAFEGVDHLAIDDHGDLLARVNVDEVIRFRRPTIYQPGSRDAERHRIDGRYVLDDAHQVSFEVAAYDTTRPLVIDPVLVYSTYLGGSNSDEPGIVFGSGRTIAVDADGSTYITGQTSSVDFPTTAGAPGRSGFRDAFVTKLSADGSSLVYSTYLGGAGEDWANGIGVDPVGNAYVTGYTESGDFPFTLLQNSGGTVFVTKLDATGSALVYSRQFGASGDSANSIAVDSAGSAYITGVTYNNQNGFPVTDGAPQSSCAACIPFRDQFRDAFVTKLTPAGDGLAYSTFLGGTGGDVGQNIAVDADGNAYVTGYTASNDFPIVNAMQDVAGGGNDAFVTKVNADGTGWVYSTYLGGADHENRLPGSGPPAGDIAVDASGNAYVTGFTMSSNFPTSTEAGQTALRGGWDAFVTKLGPAGASTYSTLLGGSSQDSGYGIAVDAGGHAYVTGDTYSDNFPTVDALQSSRAGNDDVFVAKLNGDGSDLLFSTYWGGMGGDVGRGITLDGSGNAYVVGNTIAAGFPPDPGNNDFPTTAGAFQTTSPGDMDVFVLTIGEEAPNQAPHADAGADQTVTAGGSCTAEVGLDGTGSTDPDGDSLTYRWTKGTTTLADTRTATVILGAGAHSIALTVDDGRGGTSSATVVITVLDQTAPAFTVPAPVTLEQDTPDGTVYAVPVPEATDNCDPNPTVVVEGVPAGGVFPNGTTFLTYTASDSSRNSHSDSTSVTVVDTTPPVLGAVADLIVDATSPNGAMVTFVLPSAVDNGDASPKVTSSPASGSLFPIGQTTVDVTAVDRSGNASTATLTVTVRTPAQMTSNLLVETTLAGFRQARGLLESIIRRGAAAGSGDPPSCNQLGAFINQVRAQTGKQLQPAQAAGWMAAANRIRATLGCS